MNSLLQKGLSYLPANLKPGQSQAENIVEESAAASLVAIDHQGEQLGNAEDGLDKIDGNLDDVNKTLTGLEESTFSYLYRTVFGQRKLPEVNVRSKLPDVRSKLPDVRGRLPTFISSRLPGGAGGGDAEYVDAMNGQLQSGEIVDQPSINGREGGVIQLEKVEAGLGRTIEGQNPKLDRMNEQADNIIGRLGSANQRVQKLLK